jgi:hypothetical protein
MVDSWTELGLDSLPGSVPVPDNGYELLIAWLVAEINPALVAVVPDPPVSVHVDQWCEDADGNVTYSKVLLSDEDREEFARMVDGYLIDAGVPPLPRGYAVQLLLPAGVPTMDELCSVCWAAVAEVEDNHPSATAVALRPALQARYPQVPV